MQRIKHNDQVVVIAGKNKGRQGKVTRVLENKVFVSGVNMVKRHTKPNPLLGRAAGIIEKEAPVHISNVVLFNSETGKADRVGFRIEDGKKVRFYKSNGKLV